MGVDKSWRVLTREDLRMFDNTAKAAIQFAMDRGAVGRLSSKGHALLRAPGGETISVSRNTNKSKQVLESNIRRTFAGLPTKREQYLAEQEEQSAQQQSNGSSALKLADSPTLECRVATCDATFVTEGARYAHENGKHLVCEEPGCDFVTDWPPARTNHHKAVHQGIKPVGNRGRKGETPPHVTTERRDGRDVMGQVCTGACGEWKPLDAFPRRASGSYQRRCRPCLSDENNARQKAKRRAGRVADEPLPVEETTTTPTGSDVLATLARGATVNDVVESTPSDLEPRKSVADVAAALEGIIADAVADKDRRIVALEADVARLEKETGDLRAKLQLLREALEV